MHILIVLIVIVVFLSIEYSLGKMLRNAVVEIAMKIIKNKFGNSLKNLLLDWYFSKCFAFVFIRETF